MVPYNIIVIINFSEVWKTKNIMIPHNFCIKDAKMLTFVFVFVLLLLLLLLETSVIIVPKSR